MPHKTENVCIYTNQIKWYIYKICNIAKQQWKAKNQQQLTQHRNNINIKNIERFSELS